MTAETKLAKRSPLLPDRHPIQDFFICDVTDAIPKDDMGSMEHPIFSLGTKPDLSIREYEHKGVKISVLPGALGLATIHDKDILIYCISQLMAKMNAGVQPQKTLHLKAYDLLVSTNRNTDGRGYEQLKNALDRLSGTRIRTNIKTGEQEVTEGFGLIDSWKIIRQTANGKMTELRINLSDWVFNAVVGREVLTLQPGLFQAAKAARTAHLRAGAQALRPAGPMGYFARTAQEKMRLGVGRLRVSAASHGHLQRGSAAQSYSRLRHIVRRRYRAVFQPQGREGPCPRKNPVSHARPRNLPRRQDGRPWL